MKTTRVCPVAIGLLVLSGCAGHRNGVIGRLPSPIARRRAAPVPVERRRSGVTAPAGREQAGRLLPLRRVRGEENWVPPGGISDRWRYIVVHHSGGPSGDARTFDRYHRTVNGWDELGYHFVIGNGTSSGDGEIEVGPRWIKQKHGAHCKTPDNRYNDHGIGICLVGDFRWHPPSRAQMASLVRLTRFLVGACHISVDHVVTHRGVTGHTACPGTRFPLYALRRALSGYATASALPAGAAARAAGSRARGRRQGEVAGIRRMR